MAQCVCEICGATFEQKSRYERHMLTSHPEQAASAADIEKALEKFGDHTYDSMADVTRELARVS